MLSKQLDTRAVHHGALSVATSPFGHDVTVTSCSQNSQKMLQIKFSTKRMF